MKLIQDYSVFIGVQVYNESKDSQALNALQRKNSNSVQFSSSIVSDYLQPHNLQHARPPCHHQLSESTQTHVHCVGDTIQPSHPLLSPSPPAFNLSQHQGLFKWVSSLHQVAKVLASASVLPMNIQDWFPLGLTGWTFLPSKGLSRVSSNTTVQKHQFFGDQLSLWSNSHIHSFD